MHTLPHLSEHLLDDGLRLVLSGAAALVRTLLERIDPRVDCRLLVATQLERHHPKRRERCHQKQRARAPNERRHVPHGVFAARLTPCWVTRLGHSQQGGGGRST
jgi:hypothetical protein